MKLLTLAKRLDFNTETDYFDYCRDSYINGLFSQCERLFKAMTKEQKKQCLNYLKPSKGNENTADMEVWEYYFNLL